MQNFKNKLYQYEAVPPDGIWSNIERELNKDSSKNSKLVKLTPSTRRNRLLFYGFTAAASLVIIFVSGIFFKKDRDVKEVAAATVLQIENLVTQKVKDSMALNHQILERIINTAPEQKKVLASNLERHDGQAKKYLTIAGPEGQPVKISAKAAMLIVSADDEFPPKPIWNKKIDKWKQIMMSNTTSPTATSLVDILENAAYSDNVE
ncbi:MAG: hypothetical protein ABJA32_02980 [Ginsengibacter sp.]|jgi:hypothetical protein